MAKFRKKPVVIEAYTFDEMVEIGRKQGGYESGVMPYSFTINDHGITHENDDCYIICTLEGAHKMTREDMLLIGVKGEIYPCKIEIFKATYEPAE